MTSSISRFKASLSISDVYFCNLAVDGRRGLFYELDWEAHRDQATTMDPDDTGARWVVAVKDVQTKERQKRKRIAKHAESDNDGDSSDEYQASMKDEEPEGSETAEIEPADDLSLSSEEEDDLVVRTPSKKRKAKPQIVTPRSSKRTRKTLAAPTPHSKAALKARAKKAQLKSIPIRPPPPELAFNSLKLKLPEDPWLRAMQVLHVGARPDVLPCREEEFGRILRAVEGLLEEGSGGCVCTFTISYAPA